MNFSALKWCAIVLFCIVGIWPVEAQRHQPCGTHDQDEIMQRLRENKRFLKENPTATNRSDDPIYVPVKFHLLAKDDGTGRVDIPAVLRQLCDINQEIEDLGIILYIDDGFNMVDHTTAFESPTSSAGRNKLAFEKNNNGRNSVNIFITQNAQTGGGGGGTTLGFYSPSGDYVVVRKSEIGIGSGTLFHEVGHFFSLAHPHLGWEDDPWREEVHGETVTVQWVSSSQSGGSVRVELADGANCDIAGDELCDTPADYNFGINWSTACPEFNVDVFDRNGVQLDPMQNNVMSYFQGCEPYVVTPMQSSLIIADYNSSRRSNIRTGYEPDTNKMAQQVELLEPANLSTSEFFDGVFFDWTDVPHAQKYYFEIVGEGDEFNYILDETHYYATDLKPDGTYTWSVVPYNETDGCATQMTNLLFTSELSTSTDDLEQVERWQIYPNPVTTDKLYVGIETSDAFEAHLDVYGTDGRRLRALGLQQLASGNNIVTISTVDLPKGLYTIVLTAEAGRIFQKFVVQ